MNLKNVFRSVAYKRIARVDIFGKGSHQHEFNGVQRFVEFFDGAYEGEITWHYLADDKEIMHSTDRIKFYDARAKSYDRTGRSEWRLYYSGDFINIAEPDDILILLRMSDGSLHGLIIQNNSSWLRAAKVLFNLEELEDISVITDNELVKQEIEFSKTQILEELGFNIEIPPQEKIIQVAEEELTRARSEGLNFPSTKRMSELAYVDNRDFSDHDDALLHWLNKEEELFRAIEKILVERKIQVGFDSVEDFINYSLSVQNRRKSRMGYSLQNHLSHLFIINKIQFDSQAKTERNNTPDFLFPGKKAYHDHEFNDQNLTMLAAKSSCKERWRQILTEAERIRVKHLCTLEQSISIKQTTEMKSQNIILVIPKSLQFSYTDEQRDEIWSISSFIDHVKQLNPTV